MVHVWASCNPRPKLSLALQVRSPVGSSGLLAPPVYIDKISCAQINLVPNMGTCSGAGWFPTFDFSLPISDVKSPYCDVAIIDPLHVYNSVSPSKRSFHLTSGPPHSLTSGPFHSFLDTADPTM